MSCVLRLSRDKTLIDEIRSLGFDAVLARADEEGTSVNITVSDADFGNLPQQITEAIDFLQRKRETVGQISDVSSSLDFGIETRDVPVQSLVFPAELLRLAGELEIRLEVSIYPTMRENEADMNP